MTACVILFRPASSTCWSAATTGAVQSVRRSQYCSAESNVRWIGTSHARTSCSPAPSNSEVMAPGAAHRNIPGASGSGAGCSTSAAMAAPGIVAHSFCSGPAHTAAATVPPGRTTRPELRHCGGEVRKEHEPEATGCAVEGVVGIGKRVHRALLEVDVLESLRLRPAPRRCEHAWRDVGDGNSPLWCKGGDGQAGIAGTRSNIEMLLIRTQLEAADHRFPDRPVEPLDDVVPPLPPRRELIPQRSLCRPDLIGRRHGTP